MRSGEAHPWRHRAASLMPVAGCFFAAVWHMRFDWTYDPSYRYGWLVPALTAYLFRLRWLDRPEPAPGPGTGTFPWWIFLALLFPVVWLIREPNPEWRLLSIALAGGAVAAALLYAADAGGRRWAKHFAGPLLFFMASVPWPAMLERVISGAFMPLNAALTLEALHWLGIPAVRQGNLIGLTCGTLGIEEACSGIRSLQSTVMLAWFISELSGLRASARAGLICAGILTAFATNVIRTVSLSVLAARQGMDAAHHWHDAAGLAALAANALLIPLMALQFNAGKKRLAPLAAPPGRPGIPGLGPAVCAAGLTLMLPLTAWWYGHRETISGPSWYLVKPAGSPAYREVNVDGRTANMLRYSRGWSAKWLGAGNKPFHGFYFEWDAGRVPPENMNVHQPGGCLSAIGMKPVAEYAPIPIAPGGHPLHVRLLRFDDGGRPLHVAYLVSEDKLAAVRNTAPFDFGYGNRMDYVLKGRRNPGQRFIEIGLWDVSSEAEARGIFTALLTEGVREVVP